MKFLVFLLCMLATQQWLLCETSMNEVVGTGADDYEGFFFPSRRLLSELDEDTKGMEKKIVLTNDSDDELETSIEKHKKESKQLEDLVIEAIKELNSNETKQNKEQELESTVAEKIGDDEILLDDSREEDWLQDESKKKRKQDLTELASAEDDSSDLDLFTGEKQLRIKQDRVKGTKSAEQQKRKEAKVENGLGVRMLDGENSNIKEDAVEGLIIETKARRGSTHNGSKTKHSYGDLARTTTKELFEDETPVILFENKIHRGEKDSIASSNKELKGVKKQKQVENLLSAEYTQTKKNGEREEKQWQKQKTQKPKIQKRAREHTLQNADLDLSESNVEELDSHAEFQQSSSVNTPRTLDGHSVQADMEGKYKSQLETKRAKLGTLDKNRNSHVNNEENMHEEGKELEFVKARKKLVKKEKAFPEEDKRSFQNSRKKEKFAKIDGTEEGYKKSKSGYVNTREGNEELNELVNSKNAKVGKKTSREQLDAYEKLPKEGKKISSMGIKQEERDPMVQNIIEGAKEATNSAVLSTGLDEEDEEYSDFSDLSMKLHDTAFKVADHLGPNIQKLTDTSKTYFTKANQQITESFSPLVGKQFAPFIASLLSYGLLLVPLVVVIILFEHIRAILSLQKVLLFVNLYLAAYFATLLLVTFIMGEPMNFFYRSSANGYVHLQLLQALGYIIYLILQTIDLVSCCSSEACSIKVTALLQWFVAVTIGFHFYVTVFHRAMVLKGPHINWKIYGIYSSAFMVLCLFARIKRVKKGYIQVGQPDTDKKQ